MMLQYGPDLVMPWLVAGMQVHADPKMGKAESTNVFDGSQGLWWLHSVLTINLVYGLMIF